jgi:uncharacterized membrane protein
LEALRLRALIRDPFVLTLILGAALRIVLILLVAPITDGYYFTTESARHLPSLVNPYNHTFTDIPANLLTKGSEQAFAYLPLVAVYSTAFQLLLGDIRYGLTVADLIIAYSIHQINKNNRGQSTRRATLLSAVYLLSPLTILWTSWTGVNTCIGVAFLMLSLTFLYEDREKWAGVSFGLSLAALQLSWILVPTLFVHSLHRGRDRARHFILYAVVACAAVMLPFLIPSPRDMISDVLVFHLARDTTPLFKMVTFPNAEINISLNAVLNALHIATLPLYAKILILAPALVLALRRSNTLENTIRGSLVFSTIFLFVLPNNLLINYLLLPIPLLLIVILPTIPAQRKAEPAHAETTTA